MQGSGGAAHEHGAGLIKILAAALLHLAREGAIDELVRAHGFHHTPQIARTDIGFEKLYLHADELMNSSVKNKQWIGSISHAPDWPLPPRQE